MWLVAVVGRCAVGCSTVKVSVRYHISVIDRGKASLFENRHTVAEGHLESY